MSGSRRIVPAGAPRCARRWRPGGAEVFFRRTRPRADGARRGVRLARLARGRRAQRPFGRGGVASASRVGGARRPPLRRGRRRRRPRCRRCVGVVGPPRCVRPSPRCDRRARQRPRRGAPRRGRVPIPGSKGGGGARTDARRAASAARGRAASMFNLALSSLHLRGGADHAQAALSILLDFMPAMGVAPDVVARCVVADACARAGDAEAAAAVLADARDAAGAGKRSKSKEKKKEKKPNAKPPPDPSKLSACCGGRWPSRRCANPRVGSPTAQTANAETSRPSSTPSSIDSATRGSRRSIRMVEVSFIGWTDPPRG